MAKFTYTLENGEYVFYKDGKLLKTPDGNTIKTDKEILAKQLQTYFDYGHGYTSPTSLLTYHYTYCNLKAEYTAEFVADDFSNCISAETLMADDYLMFRQPSPINVAVASFFEKELPECFHKYELNELAAILVIHTSFGSWMLSHYIITDIIDKLSEDENADYNALREEFMEDLKEYE